jgi:hypothetical protein
MTRGIITRLGLSVWALSILSCSSSDLIRNPNVERWCGEKPCDWQVEGDVQRVGTWHPNDYAVSLASDDATLTQENGTVDYRDTDCFDFTMVAKIDSGVDVYLELDFLADGTVEFSQRLPVSKWERRTFRVTAPDWYSKVRFIIRKDGPGRAILAEISAQTAKGQCTAPPIELLERPEGALCTSADQCAKGAGCNAGRCAGCTSDASCTEGEICGLRDIDHARYSTCLERASTPLGAACDSDQQCETGTCSDGACSECASDADCEEGRLCNLATGRPGTSRYWPKLCGSGQFVREPGEACADDRDCQSSACSGFEVECAPNLDCQNSGTGCLSCGPELQLGTCR